MASRRARCLKRQSWSLHRDLCWCTSNLKRSMLRRNFVSCMGRPCQFHSGAGLLLERAAWASRWNRKRAPVRCWQVLRFLRIDEWNGAWDPNGTYGNGRQVRRRLQRPSPRWGSELLLSRLLHGWQSAFGGLPAFSFSPSSCSCGHSCWLPCGCYLAQETGKLAQRRQTSMQQDDRNEIERSEQ